MTLPKTMDLPRKHRPSWPQQEVLTAMSDVGVRHVTQVMHGSMRQYHVPRAMLPVAEATLAAMLRKGLLSDRDYYGSCVLTDRVRACVADLTIDEFNNKRMLRLRELLSAEPSLSNFQKVVEFLDMSETSDAWRMLMDYAEAQLADWDCSLRQYEFVNSQSFTTRRQQVRPVHQLCRTLLVGGAYLRDKLFSGLHSPNLTNIEHLIVKSDVASWVLSREGVETRRRLSQMKSIAYQTLHPEYFISGLLQPGMPTCFGEQLEHLSIGSHSSDDYVKSEHVRALLEALQQRSTPLKSLNLGGLHVLDYDDLTFTELQSLVEYAMETTEPVRYLPEDW